MNRVFNTAARFFNILVFKKAGQVPTVPVLLDIDQQNPLWKIPTDLLDGEYCINNKDKLVFIRIYDKIYTINISALPVVISLSHARLHALNSTADHTSGITPGHIIDADGNGLPHDSTISSAVLLAALVVVGGVRTGRLTLVGGVPYNEVFTVGGVPDPLTPTWIFAGDPRCFNNIPAKVDPVITNITAAGFTAQTSRDAIMTYTAINLI